MKRYIRTMSLSNTVAALKEDQVRQVTVALSATLDSRIKGEEHPVH